MSGGIREWLEILGGSRPLPSSVASHTLVQAALGLWWVALFLIVVASSGQNIKFIYIDF